MLANDGAHDPIFGRVDFGDRVVRARLTTRAGDVPLYLTVAGDRVVEDDLARLALDQRAWQGIASVLWADKRGRQAGAYAVWRDQAELAGLAEAADAPHTRAAMVDLFFDLPITLSPDWQLDLAAEAAGIRGWTERVATYAHRDGLDVLSAGVVGRAQLSRGPWSGAVWSGWASGDGDAEDGVSHDFAYDRDFNVGMVMFDELGGAVEAAAYAQLTDPENAAYAPAGAEALVTEGALHRAVFVQPVVGGLLQDWLDLRAGVLWGWATAPVAQPFATFRNGGVPANQLGQTTEGYRLGTEIDWSVAVGSWGSTEREQGVALQPEVRVQGGHLFATPDYANGEILHLVMASARVRW